MFPELSQVRFMFLLFPHVSTFFPHTHILLNVWYIYQHVAIIYGKCRYIGHTLSIWDRVHTYFMLSIVFGCWTWLFKGKGRLKSTQSPWFISSQQANGSHPKDRHVFVWRSTLQGTNRSPKNGHFESMIFLFPRWDMDSFPGKYPVTKGIYHQNRLWNMKVSTCGSVSSP